MSLTECQRHNDFGCCFDYYNCDYSRHNCTTSTLLSKPQVFDSIYSTLPFRKHVAGCKHAANTSARVREALKQATTHFRRAYRKMSSLWELCRRKLRQRIISSVVLWRRKPRDIRISSVVDCRRIAGRWLHSTGGGGRAHGLASLFIRKLMCESVLSTDTHQHFELTATSSSCSTPATAAVGPPTTTAGAIVSAVADCRRDRDSGPARGAPASRVVRRATHCPDSGCRVVHAARTHRRPD